MTMNRRAFAMSLAAAACIAPARVAAQREATPEAQPLPLDTVTFRTDEELWPGVTLDHYRVIDLSPTMPDVSVVIGSMVNTGDEPIDVPFGISIVVRDPEDVIIGDGLLIADYPVLPPGEPMGFGSIPIFVPFGDIDPSRVVFDIEAAHDMDTGAVDLLESHTLELVSATDVSQGDGSLAIECVVMNTSDHDFENGIDPRIAVWSADGLYCGNAFANVFTRIPAGDTIRFETQTRGSTPNPLDLAGDDFTWKPWIAPR